MKKLNVKKAFILIMFLWLINMVCAIWLSIAVSPLFAFLFGVGIQLVYGLIIWGILQKLR